MAFHQTKALLLQDIKRFLSIYLLSITYFSIYLSITSVYIYQLRKDCQYY